MARAQSTASSWSTSSKELSCSSKGALRWTTCAGCSRGLAWKIRPEAATTLRCTKDGESQDNKENHCCQDHFERKWCFTPHAKDYWRDGWGWRNQGGTRAKGRGKNRRRRDFVGTRI